MATGDGDWLTGRGGGGAAAGVGEDRAAGIGEAVKLGVAGDEGSWALLLVPQFFDLAIGINSFYTTKKERSISIFCLDQTEADVFKVFLRDRRLILPQRKSQRKRICEQ